LRELVDHLGSVHQWAAHAVVEGNPIFQPEPAEPSRTALVAWYRGHASHLIDVLAERPVDAQAWTMDAGNPTAGFWRRRQVHETVMHSWDAEEALGVPRSIEPSLAWERRHRGCRCDLPPAIATWTPRVTDRCSAARGPGRARRPTLGHGEPVEVRGEAEALLRLLWHRAEPNADEVDPRASALLSAAVTP